MSDSIICSFCGKDSDKVALMVAGENANICSECAVEAYKVVRSQTGDRREPKLNEICCDTLECECMGDAGC